MEAYSPRLWSVLISDSVRPCTHPETETSSRRQRSVGVSILEGTR
ncbi:MAG: hypothetical protein ACJASK_000001, partial [Ilumatobacter sp.]